MRDNFFLKGGALLYSYDRFEARPTLDIDFLGQNISREIDNIKDVFRIISQIENPEDGILFEQDTIEAHEITVNKEYHGVRLTIVAHLDSIIQPISMDIGFGDIITPKPQVLEYPVLIEGLKTPVVMAYSMETVIAEKFEAMITLASDNSRMKDFFDIYRLLSRHDINKDTLTEAIAESNPGVTRRLHNRLLSPTTGFPNTATDCVGKTYLIKRFFNDRFDFYMSGVYQLPMTEQLGIFADRLKLYFNKDLQKSSSMGQDPCHQPGHLGVSPGWQIHLFHSGL